MSKHRDYITWVDSKTNERKSLIGELLDADQTEAGGANKLHIEGLPPHEQYAIFMAMIKRENKALTSVNEVFESYVKYAREKGAPPVARDRFITETKARKNATLVRIGDKDYFLGLGLKK
ncbi:hypothetical protein [Ktedonobacter racemifer]|uniref:Uncharacterized protein n=1 Tax=Ktedonobacter racemifer DSM 44963 TaxID=485913 RepID=D6U025_KTERA|nr:hypothetical protein [Ktedonobacter racemifer]EFH82165.1 hypothetical protein Krac_2950 [Ktedonobacter racemifer DSM 44963]